MTSVNVKTVEPEKITARVVEGNRIKVNVTPTTKINVKVFSRGLPGPPGAAGVTFDYVHTQSLAASTWVIVHNLGGYPNVTLVDTLGREFEAQKKYDSPNQVTIGPISPATAGSAFLS